MPGSDGKSNPYAKPNKPNPALAPLAPLVGEWDLTASRAGNFWSRGQAEFHWIQGGAFLAQHSGFERPEFPVAEMVIGSDGAADEYVMLYADSHGVSRVYRMTFAGGIWTLTREAVGVAQRFSGTFTADGRTIDGYWEKSDDGVTWERDFELTYMRLV